MGKAARHRRENAAEAVAGMFDGPVTAADALRAKQEARRAAASHGEGPTATAPDEAVGGRRTSAADQVFPQFPYERKFTRAEIADILERSRIMGDRMRDGVGPNGANLYIPGDLFELWMIHGVLAGADGGQPFIRSRRLPDANGQLEDAVEWVVLKDDTPAARDADIRAEAEAAYAAMTQSLRPEVANAVRRMFRQGVKADNADRAEDLDATLARDDASFGAPRLMHFGPDNEQDEQR